MKILVMVLSYTVPPYDELMAAQISTWDSVLDVDIGTVYYHGGADGGDWVATPLAGFPEVKRYQLAVNATDKYYYMAAKFKKALEFVKDWDYDVMFRTNSSSYVNKKALKEFAAKLPTEKLYAGWEIQGNAGYNVVSGAGIFMSKDVAEILRKEIDPDFEREEDVVIGEILSKHDIKIIDDKSRYDINVWTGLCPLDRYHYRFKGPHGDRKIDAHAMRQLHKGLTS